MADDADISTGVSQVFAHRESFVVLALTGRTGSGCSTVAKILATDTFGNVEFPILPTPPNNHEDRKDRIVSNWLREHWTSFRVVQASQIILLLSLSDPLDDFLNYLKRLAPNVKSETLREIISPHYELNSQTLQVVSGVRTANNAAALQASAYILTTLPAISERLKTALDAGADKYYTKVFQALGDNVRRSGNALSHLVNTEGLFRLPATIAAIIKLFRVCDRINSVKKNYFAIDALRHPFEIRYLRERISSFYSLAVLTDEISRRSRLADLGYSKKDIDELDAKEYPSEIKDPKKRPAGYSAFVSQDIQACVENATIYIDNPGTMEEKNLQKLSRQICRYVALMQHPGLVTPTNIERCMHSAFSAKLNSGCISRQVGAVVTDKNFSIKAIGWNDVPRGQVPCLLRNTSHALTKNWDPKAYSKFETNDETFRSALIKTTTGKPAPEYSNGRNITFCFKTIYNGIKKDKNQVHTRSLHAEENAFLQIAKYGGQGLEGGSLFTTASPCELCAKKAYQLGVARIYYIDPYPGISRDHVLASGEKPPEVILFSGAIGRAYHELYEPIMPYKDELNLFVQNAT